MHSGRSTGNERFVQHGHTESLYSPYGRVAACCDRARRRVCHVMEPRVPLRSQCLCVIDCRTWKNFLLGSSLHRHAPRRRGYIARPPASRETRICANWRERTRQARPSRLPRNEDLCHWSERTRQARPSRLPRNGDLCHWRERTRQARPPASRETGISTIGENGRDKRVPPVSCPH